MVSQSWWWSAYGQGQSQGAPGIGARLLTCRLWVYHCPVASVSHWWVKPSPRTTARLKVGYAGSHSLWLQGMRGPELVYMPTGG